jgi:hypothetical protein
MRKWTNKLGVAAVSAVLGVLAWQAAANPIDFHVYRDTAVRILNGDWNLYPTDYDGPEPVSGHRFRYAPAIGILFLPLGLVPLKAGALAFFALKILALLYMASVVTRSTTIASGLAKSALLPAVLVAGYLADEFTKGNFHFLVVALMVLALDGARRGQRVLPAAALAVAIASKITPLMLLAYFVLKRRMAVAGLTLAMLAVAYLLPAPSIGFAANNRLFGDFARYAAQKVGEDGNYSLMGALVRHLGDDPDRDPKYPDTSLTHLPDSVIWILWIGLFLTGAGFLAVVFARGRIGAAGDMLDLALILTAILLASPHTQRIHFSALFVPAAVLSARLRKDPSMPLARAGRVALAATAGASTILPAVLGSRERALAYEASSPYFFATLMLFAVLAALALRQRAGAPEGP